MLFFVCLYLKCNCSCYSEGNLINNITIERGSINLSFSVANMKNNPFVQKSLLAITDAVFLGHPIYCGGPKAYSLDIGGTLAETPVHSTTSKVMEVRHPVCIHQEFYHLLCSFLHKFWPDWSGFTPACPMIFHYNTIFPTVDLWSIESLHSCTQSYMWQMTTIIPIQTMSTPTHVWCWKTPTVTLCNYYYYTFGLP